MAPRRLPPVRRGGDLLAALGDGQGAGRHPGDRFAGRGRTLAAPRGHDLVPSEEDARWVEAHLGPLVGLTRTGDDRADHAEDFAAWRRFLEAIAETGTDRAPVRGSPLGGRGPARLRRLPRRMGDRSADAHRLHGSPRAARAPAELGRREAERPDHLALSAVRRGDVAASRGAARAGRAAAGPEDDPLARAGGNPLYAEEFVRMLAERDRGDQHPTSCRCPRRCRA